MAATPDRGDLEEEECQWGETRKGRPERENCQSGRSLRMQIKCPRSVNQNSCRSTTIWQLIIDRLHLCCLLLLLPFFSPRSFFLSWRLDTGLRHESFQPVFGSVTSHFCCPSSRRALPPLSPTLCCYGTCQVATGTLTSPLICVLNLQCWYHPNQLRVAEKRKETHGVKHSRSYPGSLSSPLLSIFFTD